MKEIIKLFNEVGMLEGILETLYMVFISTFISFIVGIALGILCRITDKDGLRPLKMVNRILDIIINMGRSIPFIILMLALTPFIKFLIGKSYGVNASVVALTIAAIPFVSRLVYISIKDIDYTLVESVKVMGATVWQIIYRVYLVETIPAMIRNFSLTLITLVGYSAMAGAIGGGGIGNIAMVYGYHRFDKQVMLMALVIIVILVQIMQVSFEKLAKKIDKK
jgi:D-methionine transport system permease protein